MTLSAKAASAAGVLGTRASSNCKLKRAAVYVRRRPERSAAYQVVRENLEKWLAQRRAGRLVAGANWMVDPVPGYVERDLRKFLECGILAHGFARARCEKCAPYSLVAYSCKEWGSLRSSAAGSPADLDGEQLFCYSSSMRSKMANGVFAV